MCMCTSTLTLTRTRTRTPTLTLTLTLTPNLIKLEQVALHEDRLLLEALLQLIGEAHLQPYAVAATVAPPPAILLLLWRGAGADPTVLYPMYPRCRPNHVLYPMYRVGNRALSHGISHASQVPTRPPPCSFPSPIPCTTMLTAAAAAAFIAACSGSSVCTLARCTCTGGSWVTYVPRLTTGRQLLRGLRSSRAVRSVGRVTVRGARQAGAAGVASVRAPHRFGGGLVVVEAGRRVHGKLPPARRGGAHCSLERLRFPGERLCV